jgi:hypothetical protein
MPTTCASRVLPSTLILLALAASSVFGATLRVCASGCQYTDLQQAIDAAQPGDTILLRAGESFVGHFRLRAKTQPSGGPKEILIRSDAPDTSLPAPGVRLVPASRPGGNTSSAALARLVGIGGNYRTTPVLRTDPGASHYRLQFIEVDGLAQEGWETLIALGTGSETSLSALPRHITLDRVHVHGHPVKGQKRCVALNSAHTEILNSYISECMAYFDAQAIGGWNGPGPFRIINNFLEGAGENVIFGGTDPKISNLVPSDIEIRRNHLYKPPAWRDPILRPVAGTPKASLSPAAGRLAAGTHHFRVVAVLDAGGAAGVSAPSAEVAVAVPVGTTAVTLSWTAVEHADRYRVYRGTSAGGQSVYLDAAGTSLVYTGLSERTGTPRATGTTWTAKNLLELKNAQRVVVDGNLLEHNWLGFQNGYAILLTPRNQNGTAPWSVVRDITFTNNILRSAAAGFNIFGYDNLAPSRQTRNVRIANNLFYDLSGRWGNTGRFLLIHGGPRDIVVDHNTVFHEGTVIDAEGPQVPGLVFTNNLMRHNTYGIKGRAAASGNDTLEKFFPGAVVTHNVLAGGRSSQYPPGNHFPSVSEFEAQFHGDFRLVSGSAYGAAGTGGTALGVDVPALIAAQGGTSTKPAPPPPDVNEPPIARAGGPYAGVAGTLLVMDGSASSDPDGTVAAYYWNTGEEVLIYARDIPAGNVHGRWAHVSAAGAAGGIALENRDLGEPKPTSARAAPANFVDVTFFAARGVAYHLWLRMRAAGDHWANDSVYVQFSGSLDADGKPAWRVGTTDALSVILEAGHGAGLAGWGWADNGWGARGEAIYFEREGPHTLRIQQREDGVSFDQIVLSARTFVEAPPGGRKGDATIVPQTFGVLEGVSVAHAYRAPGAYPVALRVVDNEGAAAVAFTTATIGPGGGNLAPIARPGGPYDGTAGAALTLDGRASSDGDGTIQRYDWSLGHEVVIHAADVPQTSLHGRWARVAAAGAAGGVALHNRDHGDPKLVVRASPSNYFDVTFIAAAGVPYHVWLRMRAEGDHWTNDSVSLQFSGSVDANGSPIHRIGTTSGDSVILEAGSGAGVAGWGWGDNRYGGFGPPVYFDRAGPQTLRVQQREDGVFIDQIVLSAGAFADRSPGATRHDTVIVSKALGTASGATVLHVYRYPGVYPVTLTVTDDRGARGSAATTATVR